VLETGEVLALGDGVPSPKRFAAVLNAYFIAAANALIGSCMKRGLGF
jgi:hypothetical protein